MSDKLTGNETHEQVEQVLSKKEWMLVFSFLHYKGEHYRALTAKELMQVWALGDGFGQLDYIELNKIEWDWSHVRDSSPAAVVAMGQKIRDILANRAHPGKRFCPKCLDTGLHLPEGR